MECVACEEEYNGDTKVPRALSCGHTFCSLCLRRMLSNGYRIHCPLCHLPHYAIINRVVQIPYNYSILEIMFRGHTRRQRRGQAQSHSTTDGASGNPASGAAAVATGTSEAPMAGQEELIHEIHYGAPHNIPPNPGPPLNVYHAPVYVPRASTADGSPPPPLGQFCRNAPPTHHSQYLPPEYQEPPRMIWMGGVLKVDESENVSPSPDNGDSGSDTNMSAGGSGGGSSEEGTDSRDEDEDCIYDYEPPVMRRN